MLYSSRIITKFNNEYHQPLKEHLEGVARLTSNALPGNFQQIAWYAGLWHDLGKYIDKWQEYLRGESQKVNHSAQGAMLAFDLCKNLDIIPAIAFVIAGHHAGLRNPARLESRDFEKDGGNWQEALKHARTEIKNFLPESLPDIELPTLRREFAIRMLFSGLVDADRWNAMRFEQKCQNPQYMEVLPEFIRSKKCLNPRSWNFQPEFLPEVETEIENFEINQLRNVFANHCITAAQHPKGLFRLTGVCGIGKTQSSLRFALLHAEHHQMHGIIYVAPLKSIIEQTADVYRGLLGEEYQENILEHHSGFEVQSEEIKNYKLDTERWDKAIIVTSGVQFYESLFSNTPSQCRKLHNIANRVILIDEAQTIPVNLAIPILCVFETLIQDWGCTIVLMSATQPAFKNLGKCDNAIDIIPEDETKKQFQQCDRVTYCNQTSTPWSWEKLAQDIQISGYHQSLTVVNTTKLSRSGYQELSNLVSGDWFHLSGRMCPAHRDEVLQEIRTNLQNNQPCHLISTQLIEAGVDVDFPRVYRQLAPLDSIIQTAGRCNRNGKQAKASSIVTIFKLNVDGANNASTEYRNRINITNGILEKNPKALSTDILDSIRKYFLQIYNLIKADGGKDIQKLRNEYNYPEVAKKFSVIDDEKQQSVIVAWKKGINLISEFRDKENLTIDDWRKLQRYTVNLPDTKEYSSVEKCPNGLIIWSGNYDLNFGVS
jgi:CRISPR-associated endonuclease/helicase Cas3